MQGSALSLFPTMQTSQRALCGVPGCGATLNIDNRLGFCRPHREAGSRMAAAICAEDGCGQQLHARGTTGFCPVHTAARWSAGQRAQTAERRSQWRICAADDCTRRLRPDNRSGRCYKHKYEPVSAADREQCSIKGCGMMLSPKNTVGRCTEHKDPRWVAAICAAEDCTRTLNVTNVIGFCGQHTNGYRRDAVLQRQYGITEADYDAMLAAQNGVCKLCGKPPKAGGKLASARLHVDHDHENGHVRDLLCNNCNRGLGFFVEDPALMRAAADYIERHAVLAAQERDLKIA